MTPDIIAHRGSSDRHPDNSWPAFEAALAEGADAIECDVQTTADGVLVVRHDLYVEDVRLCEMDEAALRQAEPDTVLAADLIDWAETRDIGLLIELKDAHSVEGLARLLESRPTDRLIIGAFSGPNLSRMRKHQPTLCTSLMIGSVLGVEEMVLLAGRYGCAGVHPCWEARDPYPHRLLSAGQITQLREQGFRVTLWHEEREDELRKLIALGPDAICTNTPAKLRALMDEVPGA